MGKIAQWIQHSQFKYEQLSWNPQHLHKKAKHGGRPLKPQGWGAETGRPQQLTDQLAQLKL